MSTTSRTKAAPPAPPARAFKLTPGADRKAGELDVAIARLEDDVRGEAWLVFTNPHRYRITRKESADEVPEYTKLELAIPLSVLEELRGVLEDPKRSAALGLEKASGLRDATEAVIAAATRWTAHHTSPVPIHDAGEPPEVALVRAVRALVELAPR